MTDLALRDKEMAQRVKETRKDVPFTPAEPVMTRRFELPDFNEHGEWLSERLLLIYPTVGKPLLWSRLNNVLYNNEFLFLYQKNAVTIAQLVRGNTLMPRPTVQEWFTFVRNPEEAAQITKASEMYADYLRWAKGMDAEAIMLNPECSDVPIEQAKVHLGGRVFERTQVFVALKK